MIAWLRRQICMDAGEYGDLKAEQEELLERIGIVEARLDALEAGVDEDDDGFAG